MSKTFTIEECHGIPDLSQPGVYFDYSSSMVYIVGPNMIYDTWCSATMPSLWDSLPHDADIKPGPVIEADTPTPEIRGFTAQDLKELLAMQHAIAAESLVRR